MTKDASLTIRLPADLKAELERLAKKDERSASSYAERLIREGIAKAKARK